MSKPQSQPVEGGKHLCSYCKELVIKKDIYPKWDDLGAAFQAKWDRHEKGEPQETANTAPQPTPGGLTEA